MSSPTRPLGQSPLQVSPLCFGGNVFGWTADAATSFALLDAWLGAGMNFVDTADVYSRWVPGHVGGESETLIGQWLKKSGKRKQLVLATKLGKDMGDGKVGLHPKYIKQAVDASLTRLQTDYIDLYQTHDDDPAIPFEDVLGTLGDLIQAGKVRALAIGSAQRATQLPQVQTLAEGGVKNSEVFAFQGMLAPAGLPPAITARLNGDLNKALGSASVKKRMADFSMEAMPGTPEQFKAFARAESKRWGEIIRTANIRLD